MKELQDAIVGAFGRMAESGALDKAIETQMEKCVLGIIQSALGQYSAFGKDLGAAIERALAVDLDKLGLTGYNETVLKAAKHMLDQHVSEQAAQELQRGLSKLLSPAPEEIKLSELVEAFKRHIIEDRYIDRDDEITLIVERSETSPGYVHIHMDATPGEQAYTCEHRLDVTPKGAVYALKTSGADSKCLFFGPHYDFSKKLFQLYAAKTRLLVDEDDCDIYMEEE